MRHAALYFGASLLLGACATASSDAPSRSHSAHTEIWRDRIALIGEPARGEVLCFETGQFELVQGETVVSRENGETTIQSPTGTYTIHENLFEKPTPTPVALANLDLMGAFYRYDEPRTGYLVTVFNPVQDGEFVVAWMEGPAFAGSEQDAQIYARFGFGVGSEACRLRS